MKCLVAVSKGGRAYAGRVLPGVILMVGAFVLTALLT
jgi:hypothetical protein